MKLIDHKDFVAIANWHDRQASNNHFPNRIDTGVRRGIKFEDIDIPTFRDFLADVTCAARVRRRAFFAIQGSCQNSSRRCFTNTSWTRKDECLGNAIADNRIPQGLGYPRLPNYAFKALRTPSSGKCLIGHA